MRRVHEIVEVGREKRSGEQMPNSALNLNQIKRSNAGYNYVIFYSYKSRRGYITTPELFIITCTINFAKKQRFDFTE